MTNLELIKLTNKTITEVLKGVPLKDPHYGNLRLLQFEIQNKLAITEKRQKFTHR